ncbi:methylated-DNA--[protein]-cysteine S-methyltransferase [Microlunatus flavus]|uniref:Methylated-DNA-[protein]-cysteine S-methyltransferase n=1 Tax=Microlunatus flavus TaxID=1036181 RepID=A0A1H9CEI7_9ACTN|nr:methylated-DNA--[protein]-cysteine S-methyltransferase [Microlunatus flavus]SEP99068.1 methylated-DNA-[protein]-cysteine S-methyltransferase [Microlunatus flavus]
MTATVERGTTGTAPGTTRRQATVATGLGEVTLVAQEDTLVGIYFAEHAPAPDRTAFGVEVDADEDRVLRVAAEQLSEYVEGSRERFDLPLEPLGSDRAREVWRLVAAVPRGETTTYAALGRAVGVGPRAAGQFVARNPLCVVVPCHRVVASDGRLTGYAGGVDRKRQLLELEGALPEGAVTVPRPATADASPGNGPEASGEASAIPGAAG